MALFDPHPANARRLEAGPRGQTLCHHFKDEADSDAFIRYLKFTIRNIMPYVNMVNGIFMHFLRREFLLRAKPWLGMRRRQTRQLGGRPAGLSRKAGCETADWEVGGTENPPTTLGGTGVNPSGTVILYII